MKNLFSFFKNRKMTTEQNFIQRWRGKELYKFLQPKENPNIPCLMNMKGIHNRRFIIQVDRGDELRGYIAFHDHLEYLRWRNASVPLDERNFFEVNLRDNPRKFAFDIDMERVKQSGDGTIIRTLPDNIFNQEFFDDVCSHSIMNVINILAPYQQLNIHQDIRIYTSHRLFQRDNGMLDGKFSAHIVVMYALPSYIHCEYVYKEAMKRMPSYITQVLTHNEIDPCVYKSTQNFRLLGCEKMNSGRPKILLRKWSYFGQSIDIEYTDQEGDVEIVEFAESLLSFHEDIISFELPVETKETNTNYLKIDFNNEQAMNLLGRYRNCFQPSSRSGNILFLRRLQSSMCPTCNRNHNSMPPYLLVLPNGNVYWCCQRAPNKATYFLGNIETQIIPSDSGEPIEIIHDPRPSGLYGVNGLYRPSKPVIALPIEPVTILDTQYTPEDIIRLVPSYSSYRIVFDQKDSFTLTQVQPIMCPQCNIVHQAGSATVNVSRVHGYLKVLYQCSLYIQPSSSTQQELCLGCLKLESVEEKESNYIDAETYSQLRYNNLRPYRISLRVNVPRIPPFHIKSRPATGIKSNCMTFKTDTLIDEIRQCGDDSILIVTFRKELSYDLLEKLNGLGFKHYLDENRESSFITDNRAIVQMDSAWKLARYYKIVIFDESEYNLDHLVGFVVNKMAVYNALRQHVQGCEHFIVMDALLSESNLRLCSILW